MPLAGGKHKAGGMPLFHLRTVAIQVGQCSLMECCWRPAPLQDKNKDFVVAEHQMLLGNSSFSFISNLFQEAADAGEAWQLQCENHKVH
jgi:hypothetical protein